ncbi:hypothetical protein TL16_g01978, partial [Triparma laevis f. inornata]
EEELPEPVFSGKTCTQCRIAKVKCDKHLPCSRCIRRGYICSAQERGPGRPPSTTAPKNKKTDGDYGKKSKRRKGHRRASPKQHAEPQQQMHPGYYPNPYSAPFMAAPEGMVSYPSVGFSQEGGWTGGFHEGAQAIPYGSYPGGYGEGMQHMQGKHGSPQKPPPKSIATQFLSKMASGSYTRDKIDDVLSYLTDLAIKRNSKYLAKTVLKALLIAETESSLGTDIGGTKKVEAQQLALVKEIAERQQQQSEEEDEKSQLVSGKPSAPLQPNSTLKEAPAYIAEWLNENSFPTSQRTTVNGETSFHCNKTFANAFFNTAYAAASYAAGGDAWKDLFEKVSDDNNNHFHEILGGVVIGGERRLEYTFLANLVDKSGEQGTYRLEVRSELSAGGHSAFHIIRLSKSQPMMSPAPHYFGGGADPQFARGGYSGFPPMAVVPQASPYPQQARQMPYGQYPPQGYEVSNQQHMMMGMQNGMGGGVGMMPPPNQMQQQHQMHQMHQQHQQINGNTLGNNSYSKHGMQPPQHPSHPFDDTHILIPEIDALTPNARVLLHTIDLLTSNSVGPILELCIRDVFVDAGVPDDDVPLLGTFIGKEKVAKFFAGWHEYFVLHTFSITDLKSLGNSVSCVASYQVTSKSSSRRSPVIRNQMKWMFDDDGKIRGIYMYVNESELKSLFVAGWDKKGDDEIQTRQRRMQRDSARDWKNMIASIPRKSGNVSAAAGSVDAPLPPGEDDLYSIGSNTSGIGSLLDNIGEAISPAQQSPSISPMSRTEEGPGGS